MRRKIWAAVAVVVLLSLVSLLARVRIREGAYDLAIEPAFQGDYREAVCVIGGKPRTVRSSGCGAVCAFMAIRHLTGADEPDPQTLFFDAYESGAYTGSGLSHEAVSAMLRENGVASEWIGRSKWRILNALRDGKPVIAHMGPGTFTDNGHYILLTAVTEEGLVEVNDPGSRARTGQAYALDLIMQEAKTNRPFCVCG